MNPSSIPSTQVDVVSQICAVLRHSVALDVDPRQARFPGHVPKKIMWLRVSQSTSNGVDLQRQMIGPVTREKLEISILSLFGIYTSTILNFKYL